MVIFIEVVEHRERGHLDSDLSTYYLNAPDLIFLICEMGVILLSLSDFENGDPVVVPTACEAEKAFSLWKLQLNGATGIKSITYISRSFPLS